MVAWPRKQGGARRTNFILMNTKLEVIKGDITKVNVDAIVNAANSSLLGGGGVDGAIHRAGGPAILEECMRYGGCEVGEAVITTAGNLNAKYVIHTVGPIWTGGQQRENILLANCYRNSLTLAVKNDARSVAFPNISTGVYRFPKEAAAAIAVSEVQGFVRNNDFFEVILFVCFDDENYSLYRELLKPGQE